MEASAPLHLRDAMHARIILRIHSADAKAVGRASAALSQAWRMSDRPGWAEVHGAPSGSGRITWKLRTSFVTEMAQRNIPTGLAGPVHGSAGKLRILCACLRPLQQLSTCQCRIVSLGGQGQRFKPPIQKIKSRRR
jgi:hypothetical protein